MSKPKWHVSAYNANAPAEDRREVINADGTLTGISIRTLTNAWGKYNDSERKFAESLLLAAPEMLAALERVVRSAHFSIDHDHNRTREACELRAVICAAIDKATDAK